MGDSHRLRLWASGPGIGATWVGRCGCGRDFPPCAHRLDVENAHQAHVHEVAEQAEALSPQNGD
jgi:hypothetical protein